MISPCGSIRPSPSIASRKALIPSAATPCSDGVLWSTSPMLLQRALPWANDLNRDSVKPDRSARVAAVDVPVPGDLGVPATVVAREHDAPADRALPAVLVAVEQVDGEGLALGQHPHE